MRLPAEEAQPEGVGPAGRNGVDIGLERGQKLLSQGKQRPQVLVAEGVAQGLEKGPFLRLLQGVDGQDLFELIEDQQGADAPRLACSGLLPFGQVVPEEVRKGLPGPKVP